MTPAITALPLAQLAADSEDKHELHAIASQPELDPKAQLAIAVNDHGAMLLDAADPLSSAHARLMARPDLNNYVARILMEVNDPQTLAAVQANLDSPTVAWAARISHVRQYRDLVQA